MSTAGCGMELPPDSILPSQYDFVTRDYMDLLSQTSSSSSDDAVTGRFTLGSNWTDLFGSAPPPMPMPEATSATNRSCSLANLIPLGDIKTDTTSSEEGSPFSPPSSPPQDHPDPPKESSGAANDRKERTKRQEQIRVASRRYREKRKSVQHTLQGEITSLEDKLAQLQMENQLLQQVNKDMALQNQQLTLTENRNNQIWDAEAKSIENNRRVYVARLQALYDQRASDAEMEQVLVVLIQYCQRLTKIGTCYLQQMLNPTSVTRLVQAQFFTKSSMELMPRSLDNFVVNFANQLKSTVSDFTAEQSTVVDGVVQLFKTNLEMIYAERERLNEELEKILRSGTNGVLSQDNLLERLTLMELVRRNLDEEASRVEDAESRFYLALTTRQRAEWFLNLEYQHASVLQMKDMWDSLKRDVSIQGANPVLGSFVQ